mmetsp:Transcript_40096/g.106047  ORF Transcript_40096/g.106047 Transcript_40096/m.106047 type:complete len:205 (+) Transcript_40096:225-839(+)
MGFLAGSSSFTLPWAALGANKPRPKSAVSRRTACLERCHERLTVQVAPNEHDSCAALLAFRPFWPLEYLVRRMDRLQRTQSTGARNVDHTLRAIELWLRHRRRLSHARCHKVRVSHGLWKVARVPKQSGKEAFDLAKIERVRLLDCDCTKSRVAVQPPTLWQTPKAQQATRRRFECRSSLTSKDACRKARGGCCRQRRLVRYGV